VSQVRHRPAVRRHALAFLLGLALSLAACAVAPRSEAPAAGEPRADAPPSPVTLTYLGVAGWSITDGVHTVLVDPYFSRPEFDGVVGVVPDEDAIARLAPPRADLVLVTHSHVDHLLDAPFVARRTGAQLLGSVSTANYGRATGLPDDQLVPVQGGEDYQFEGFSVRVIPGLHSALGDKHVFGAGDVIAADVVLPLTFEGFGEGGTFDYLVRLGGHEILVIGSANYIERELSGLRPDVAIVATGLREELHDYAGRLMRALGAPPLVLANHFDAWRAPLGEPLSETTRADLAAFAAEIRACAPETRVVVPEPLEPIDL
jgi:L-ascorbate metabolism protein UlaG (beta-lactamase superfamily)